METEKKKERRNQDWGFLGCDNVSTSTPKQKTENYMYILNNCVQHRHYVYHEATVSNSWYEL
jgi:ribosomal protein S26